MEKEEAMKILKDFHDKSALFSVRTALDTIIPELRASEKYLEIFDAQGIHGDKAIPAINWLKSLRHQNTWKPSDEQIKVCKEVYADLLSAKGFDVGTINSELNRLEEQLKKLKG